MDRRIFLLVLGALLSVSCTNPIAVDKAGKAVDPLRVPEIPSDEEIRQNAVRLLSKAFKRCPITQSDGEKREDPDVTYAFHYDAEEQRAYLLMMYNWGIAPPAPEMPAPMDAEKIEKQLAWRGTIVPTASKTAKYDILNKKVYGVDWLGKAPWETKFKIVGGSFSIPRWDFPLRKEKGVWKCELCEQYKAINCQTIDKLLQEIRSLKE